MGDDAETIASVSRRARAYPLHPPRPPRRATAAPEAVGEVADFEGVGENQVVSL